MDFINKMAEKFIEANRRLKKWQRAVSVLAAIVVFVTTYALVLPAITLDKDTASTQAGMEVAASEQEPGSGGTVYEAEPEEESAEEGQEEPVEEGGSDIGSQEAEVSEEQSSDAEPVESSQETDNTEEEPAAASGETVETSASVENSETAKTVEEVQLITEKTQLTYQYIDENFEKDPDDDVDDGYTVYAEFGASAKLPVGVELKVKEITKESNPEAYEAYYEKALSELQDKYDENTDLSFARFYDISFVYNGEEVEPSGYVRVRIEYNKPVEVKTDENVDTVHFDKNNDEKPEVIESEVKTEKKGTDDTLKTVEFESGSFSVYGVIGSYTVDFYWEVDGKTYEFSIPGGGFVSLEQLVEMLSIAEDAHAFASDVENAEFSSPELVWIGKIEEDTTVGGLKEANALECEYSKDLTEEKIAEINAQTVNAGDWALISMRPFLSEETLTVTMKNGEKFEIKVTDGQLRKYVISDSGDRYEVIVTYDDSAEIPEDAELVVKEIPGDSKEFAENINLVNKELRTKDKSEVLNPVQFDISIVSGTKEVEPKEGSIVKVEIRLAKSLFGEEASVEKKSPSKEEGTATKTANKETKESDEETGFFLYNGQEIKVESGELTGCRIAHIEEEGTAEIIDKVENSVTDDKLIMQFETTSFSDYLFDGASGNGLYNLPTTIYVGDEIYMWNQENYWVTNIGSVVTETKHNNGWDPDGWGGPATPNSSRFKTVTAINTGTFRIYNVNNQGEYRDITVLPARTGTPLPNTIDTVNNADIGLTLNLFDYDLDNYLDDYYNGSAHYDNTCIGDFANHGINRDHDLKFWGSGIGDQYGSRNKYEAHGVTSIVETNLNGGTGGYPILRNSSQDLSYLFSPSNGTDDKKAYTNVNGLFKKDGDYYVYDSNQNYAYYDKSQGNGGSFEVYERTYNQKKRDEGGEQAPHTTNKKIGFFPFHEWDEDYDLYVNWNKKLNHHFGMSMSVDFSLPKDPKAVEDTAGRPIIFEFSGDDDLWVFIDGKLAMDIGGIHQPTAGTINFQTGVVTVQNGESETDTRTQLTQSQFNTRFPDLYDGKKHTMQVFYIERGGCDSNCRIKFNLTQYGDVEFEKVDEDNEDIKLAGAVFGLYKDDKCTQPLMERLKDGTVRSFVVETDENGHAKLEGIPLGDYYLKEIHAPSGYPLSVGGETARVRVYLDENGNIKTSIGGQEEDAKITNKKPTPINLGLKKEWQDYSGETISAPDGVNATFEIKRIRSYEIIKERKIDGHGESASHLVVGWIHNNQPNEYEEFDLIAGTQATVSWSYVDGYQGTIKSSLNGNEETKPANPNNIYSRAFTMPDAGQTALFYIIDDSENGEAIRNINVAGSQFYGNSGGGYVHEFHTFTEQDPEFTYTGANVTDNKVTLPNNENTWQYIFSNLPTFENGSVTVALEEGGEEETYDVAFRYSYYLEEVSNTAPEGTTVIYKDLNGNEISSPIDAETSTSGTETITNKIPFGYLKIEKRVTYNNESEDLRPEQKSKLAGEYKFKIYTKQQCGDADAVQDPNAEPGALDKDLIITITIGNNGEAVSSEPIQLLAGKYWVKEVESSNPVMFPINNPIEVTVTKNHTTSEPAISTITNNYDENNGPDKISLDIVKKFQGLDATTQIPANFQVVIQYTLGGQTKTVTLKNATGTGENGETINWTENGFTWHWKVSNIDSEATDFMIKEENYDNATGYDWESATLDKTDITETVTNWHHLSITAPKADLEDVTNDRRTSDSGANTEFYLDDGDIILSKLTGNKGTLVVSKHPLNLAERDAVKKGIPNQFKKTCVFFSIDEHPNGFIYDQKTVTFAEKGGRMTAKFSQSVSAQETVFAVTYSSEDARNNANLVNTYKEVPITIDIIKVEEKNLSKKLPGAIFTLRQLADEEPTESGTIKTLDGTTPIDSTPTDSEGKTSFSNLTHGYYEISEKKAPDGYNKSEMVTSYFKIDSGIVTWLVKGTTKPSKWVEKTEKGENELVDFEPAHIAVGAQSATNATFTVENMPGASLPYTGGPGSNMIYLLGIMLTGIAAAGFVLRRKRKTV